MRACNLLFLPLTLFLAGPARAADADTIFGLTIPEWLSLHAQTTFVDQYHPSFRSPFEGANSLTGQAQSKETVDATLFLGVRLLDGLEVYVNPEIDQGFGLSDTFGLAGFPSGEAYKVGHPYPYFRLHRAFLRYTADLGGDSTKVEDAANQVAGQHSADSLTVTVGKFSVVDIFDTNSYAHDPRADFFNWSIIDSGGYDYAANSWGYSVGAAVEWTKSWWTLRAGAFNLSTVANGPVLETNFSKFEMVAEAEERHELFSQPGKVKALLFVNHGPFGGYRDAVALALATGTTPDTGLVKEYRSRPGGALNVEQGLSADLGMFVRVSANDGGKETYEFTEINRSVALGLSLKGKRWGREDDTVGLAAVINDISADAKAYFAAGGLGTLIGDGQLPRSGAEKSIELYYKVSLTKGIALTFDYQHFTNPAYDAARGPIDIFGVRFHAEF